MRRREFIAGLGAAAWPVGVARTQGAVPVIGLLSSETPKGLADRLTAFRQGLNEGGYVESRNVIIEYRWADGEYNRLPELAAELVRRGVAVIVTPGSVVAARAAMAATTTIPIVFQSGVDPVAAGLVASLNRPSGNVTGVTTLGTEVESKRVELIHEVVPKANIIALLVNPALGNIEDQSKAHRDAARILGLQLHVLSASAERDFDGVFADVERLRAGALVIGGDAFLIGRSEQLAALALRYAVPAIFQYREFVQAGGLMSYGGSILDATRLVGFYTGRVLRGERPADLPVQQGTKVLLTINLKTAKSLGITFPLTLLGRADEVIE
jgi:putative ABC transport system substrate-binding protein